MFRLFTTAIIALTVSLSYAVDFEYFSSHGAYRIASLILLSEDIDPLTEGMHYLYQGDLYLREGKWNSSLLNYKLFLLSNPLSSYKGIVLFNMGRLYYIKGDRLRAKDAFNKSYRICLNDKHIYNARSYIATMEASDGNLTEAKETYEDLFRNSPPYLHTDNDYYRYSQVLISLNKYKEAVKALCRIDADDERFVQSQFYLSKLLYRIDNQDKALRIINSIIKSNSDISKDDSEILLYSSALNYKLGYIEEAVKNLNIISNEPCDETDDDCLKAKLLLGFIEFQNSKYENTIKILKDVPDEKIKTSNEIPYLLALSYYKKGLLKEAEETLEAVISSGLTLDEKSLYLLGWIYFLERRYSEAKITFERVRDIGGELALASTFMTAESTYKQYRYDDALRGYIEIVETATPSQIYFESMIRIADCRYNQGKVDEAIEIYEKFIKIPDIPSDLLAKALYSLGYSYSKKNDYKNTIEYYERFLAKFSNDENSNEVILALLDILEDREDYGGIIKTIERYNDTFFNRDIYSKLLIHKGRAYYNLGLYKQAERIFATLIKDYTDTDEAIEAEYYRFMVDYHLGKYHSPLEASEAFLNENPASPLSPGVRIIIAKYYLQNGEYQMVENLLMPVIEGSTDIEATEAAAAMLESVYKKQGKEEQLAEIYTDLSEKATSVEDKVRLLLMAAISYTNAGMVEEAITVYTNIISNYPQGDHIPKTLYNLGALYKDIGLYQHSQTIFERLIDKYTTSEYYEPAVLNLAFTYQHLGELGKAIEFHTRVLSFNNRSLTVQSTYWLADCYHTIGDNEKALVWLDKLLKEYKDFPNWVKKGEKLRYTITGGKGYYR